MQDAIEGIRVMAGASLATQRPTPELIREKIELVRKIHPPITNDAAEKLAREFEAIHDVTMDLGAILENDGFEKWLEDARSEIDFYFWGRYRKLLAEKRFSAHVLASLDEVTDRTLGLLENPRKEGKWDRRGMVVGHVQSGKTANYTGLICKAADAGYEVIIVIAGLHNNLRNQTQMRLDEGFTGFDSSKLLSNNKESESIIGVGRHDRKHRPNSFTNTIRDFNKQTATSIGIPLKNLNQPVLFVIKKNTWTLKNLLEWLREHNAKGGASSIRAPMLLIDDEADNASINIRKRQEDVSRINGQIRELLGVFDRSCYIGYTATPFANIFIDPESDNAMFGEDLFPRDFIVSLDPPDNYFGSSRVFLDEPDSGQGSSIIRYIEDNGDLLPLKHRKVHQLIGLPDSLKFAIRTFILARAIRLGRDQTGMHNSMLVNASIFTDVQRQLRNEVHMLLEQIRSSIRVNGAKPEADALNDPEIRELHEVFLKEYSGNCGLEWTVIQERLWESISPIKAVEVNSKSSGTLDYSDHEKHGLNVIAIGGFSLSRGLTLEGLTISYFLRNSMMYDTLMQMGRWFGYRPGYEDLCRVWMPEEAEGWYSHIAESIEELREELRQMEATSATPREFGLKVRSHPDTLVVTARNKMGSGEELVVSVGLANQFVETAILWKVEEKRAINHGAAIALANNLRSNGFIPVDVDSRGDDGEVLLRGIPAFHVLEFLTGFQNHPGSLLTATEPVRKYIEDRDSTELSEWDVLFPGLKNAHDTSLVDCTLGFRIVCQRRTPGNRGKTDPEALYITEKQRVSSRGVEKTGLSPEEIEQAKEAYRKKKNLQENVSVPNYPDNIFRKVRKRPLLVVHLLAIGSKDEDLSGQKPVVAWSISFPKTVHEEKKVEYVVNTTWLRERYLEEIDEEEAGGDDD